MSSGGCLTLERKGYQISKPPSIEFVLVREETIKTGNFNIRADHTCFLQEGEGDPSGFPGRGRFLKECVGVIALARTGSEYMKGELLKTTNICERLHVIEGGCSPIVVVEIGSDEMAGVVREEWISAKYDLPTQVFKTELFR
jgi:hypothetical protein